MSWNNPWEVSRRIEEFRDIQYKSDVGAYMITTLESREMDVETGFDDSQVRNELSMCLELINELLVARKTGSGNICIKEVLSETELSTEQIIEIRDSVTSYRDNLTLGGSYQKVRGRLVQIETVATNRINKLESCSCTVF